MREGLEIIIHSRNGKNFLSVKLKNGELMEWDVDTTAPSRFVTNVYQRVRSDIYGGTNNGQKSWTWLLTKEEIEQVGGTVKTITKRAATKKSTKKAKKIVARAARGPPPSPSESEESEYEESESEYVESESEYVESESGSESGSSSESEDEPEVNRKRSRAPTLSDNVRLQAQHLEAEADTLYQQAIEKKAKADDLFTYLQNVENARALLTEAEERFKKDMLEAQRNMKAAQNMFEARITKVSSYIN